ncbi:hypothetical protein QP38_2408 [Levilactobacillus brevis]|nr:hypothetical protein QP38_2408 [Levilactobacillus brevis]
MISASLIQQEIRRGRRVLQQHDDDPEVGDDLVSAGLRPSSAETRSRGKTVEVCGRAAVKKSSQISPKTSVYIGGRGGGPCLGAQGAPRGSAEPRGEGLLPKPSWTWFGGWESFLPFPPPRFFFFLFDFSSNAHRALLGCPTNPLRAGAPASRPMGFPGVGCPPVNSRNPFVIPGTFPVTPKTFR